MRFAYRETKGTTYYKVGWEIVFKTGEVLLSADESVEEALTRLGWRAALLREALTALKRLPVYLPKTNVGLSQALDNTRMDTSFIAEA